MNEDWYCHADLPFLKVLWDDTLVTCGKLAGSYIRHHRKLADIRVVLDLALHDAGGGASHRTGRLPDDDDAPDEKISPGQWNNTPFVPQCTIYYK